MSNVYFVRTAHQYQSYSDYFDLAELSGYPVIPLSELDPQSDNTYILSPLNGEWLGGWQNPRARIILWECEWRVDWRAEANTPPGVAEVWASDAAYARAIGARYVLFGSDARLAEKYRVISDPVEKTFDVATLMYYTPRRSAIVESLRNVGLIIAPNGWETGRDLALRSSRMMLHIHQHDNAPYNAFMRLAVAAAYKLPVVSEMVADTVPYVKGGDTYTVLYSDYANLAQAVLFGLDNLDYLGEWLHDFLCVRNTFKSCVEGAL